MSLILGRVAQLNPEMVNTDTTFLTSYPGEKYKYDDACKDTYLRRILELNNHLPNKMTYRVNSLGFRGEDWNIGTDCDVTIGSSNTWGGGNYEENIYCSVIARETKRTVYNLGYPAGTADGVFRYCFYWLPKLMPKTVYYCMPSYKRCEIIVTDKQKDTKIHKHISWGERKRKAENNQWPTTDKWYYKWFENDENSLLNNLKNMMAIKQLCDSIGAELKVTRPGYIKLTDMPKELQEQAKSGDTYKIQGGEWPIGDIGRDLKHRGATFQKLIAQRLLEKDDYKTELDLFRKTIYENN
jgi:hypothetical protein